MIDYRKSILQGAIIGLTVDIAELTVEHMSIDEFDEAVYQVVTKAMTQLRNNTEQLCNWNAQSKNDNILRRY
jgi:hypothetical protein